MYMPNETALGPGYPDLRRPPAAASYLLAPQFAAIEDEQ